MTTARCASCGAAAGVHARRPGWVRDLPSGGRPLSTWTEAHPAVGARSSWTGRARVEVCRRVGHDGHSVAQVARAFGVSWATVLAAVRD